MTSAINATASSSEAQQQLLDKLRAQNVAAAKSASSISNATAGIERLKAMFESTGENKATKTLSSIADGLGVDQETVVEELRNGRSLSNLLALHALDGSNDDVDSAETYKRGVQFNGLL